MFKVWAHDSKEETPFKNKLSLLEKKSLIKLESTFVLISRTIILE